MVRTKNCCYKGCRNDSRFLDKTVVKGTVFYPFPKPKTQLEKCIRWIKACGRVELTPDKIKKYHYVCGEHFVGDLGPTERNPDPKTYNLEATFSCDVSMSNMKKEGIKIVLRINEQQEEIGRLDEEIERLKGIIGDLKNEVEDLTEKNGLNGNNDYAIVGPVKYEPESYGLVLSLPFSIQQQPEEQIESLQSIPTESISNISDSVLEKEAANHSQLVTTISGLRDKCATPYRSEGDSQKNRIKMAARSTAVFSSQFGPELKSKLVQTTVKYNSLQKRGHPCNCDDVSNEEISSKRMKHTEKPLGFSGSIRLSKLKTWLLKKDKKECLLIAEKISLHKELKEIILEITRKDRLIVRHGLDPVKIIVEENGEASVFHIFKGCVIKVLLFEGESIRENVATDIFQQLFDDSFILCPGLTEDSIKILKTLSFLPQKLTKLAYPFEHYLSELCLAWFKPPINAPMADISSGNYRCTECSYRSRYTKTLSNKKNNLLVKNKTSPASKHKLKNLSSNSLKIRRRKERCRK